MFPVKVKLRFLVVKPKLFQYLTSVPKVSLVKMLKKGFWINIKHLIYNLDWEAFNHEYKFFKSGQIGR